ncbi:MAG: peptide ABC transporter substrate-binding protein [Bacillota bacterium]|nr:peptide ABC transporter substrate-binding protein [Bacillota bacterium]
MSRKLKIKVILLIMLIIGVVVIGGCGKNESLESQPLPVRVHEREGGVFRFQLSNDPVSLDPVSFDYQDPAARQLMYLLYDGLIEYHPDTMEPIANLATSWEISNDGKTYTFNIKEGVLFHNGKEVTAEVLKESWERLLNPAKNYPNSFLLQNIVGAEDLLSGRTKEASGIVVLSDYRLQVELETPNSNFLSILGHPATFPVNMSVIEKVGDSYGSSKELVIGTGPFQMVEWEKNKMITLEKNNNYYGHEPYIERLEMPIIKDNEEALVLLEGGKLHFINDIPFGKMNYVRNHPQLAELVIEAPFLASYYYGLNINKPPLNNVKLRQALNYAIDREVILQHLWEGIGQPLGGVVPPGFGNYKYPNNVYNYNLTNAKKLLEDIGYPMGFGLPDLVLTYNTSAGHKTIAEAIQQQLAQIGIKVILEEVSWEELMTNMQEGTGDMFRLGWIADYPDVDSFLFPSFHTQTIDKGNFLSYSNNLVDDLLLQARAESNYEKRMELYSLAESYLIADAPMLWLFSYEQVAMKGDYVEGLKINSLGVVPLEFVWLEEQDQLQ